MSQRLFLLLILLAPALPAASCDTCKGRGQIALRRDASYPRALEAQERLGLWCNYCQALGLYDPEVRVAPCPDCQALPDPLDQALPREHREALAVPMQLWWRDHDRALTIFMVTERFTVSAQIRDLPLKSHAREFVRCRQRLRELVPGPAVSRGKTLHRHERAHLWLQRMQDAILFCNRTCGLEGPQMQELARGSYRYNLLLFSDGSDLGAFKQCYAPLPRRGEENTISWLLGTSLGADDLAWSRCLHDVGIHWADRLFGTAEEEKVPGWLLIGLPFLLELHYVGQARFDYNLDRDQDGSWGGSPRFRNPVYKLVARERAPFQAMLDLAASRQDLDHRMLSWSLLEFLSSRDSKVLGRLLTQLVEGQDLDSALEASHGWSREELEQAWQAHVQSQYRAPDKRRDPLRE
jgi:hypothetical protein